jgi:hypothetical protein
MDTLGFDFRGTNCKFEIKWKPVDTSCLNHLSINSIIENFKIFEELLINNPNDKIIKYDVKFESRKQDPCNRVSYLISDDIGYYSSYMK